MHKSQEPVAFAMCIYGQTIPLATSPNVREYACWIFVKMDEGGGLPVEYPSLSFPNAR
jgi:hypothetical protein